MTPSHDPPGHGFVDLTLEPTVGRVKQRQRRPIIRCVLPYSSNTATARIGEPVPPRHLSGKPMKRNSPWPISASRLHRLSICVMSSSRHALCTSEFTTPMGPGRSGVDAKMHDPLAPQPLGRRDVDAGIIGRIGGGGKGARVMPGAEQ